MKAKICILKLQFKQQNTSAGITGLKFVKEVYIKLKEQIKDTVDFKCSQQTIHISLAEENLPKIIQAKHEYYIIIIVTLCKQPVNLRNPKH